jgi:DNA recombination protein RmuC
VTIPSELELAIELLILGVLLWLVYTRPKEENVVDAVDEPDYVERFKELSADALLDVVEKRRDTVEKMILDGLPLNEIMTSNNEILKKFKELDGLKDELAEDNEKTRNTTLDLTRAMSAGIGERGRWGEATFKAILTMSGLTENVNYFHGAPLTKSKTNPGATPDFTIMIGDGSAVALDAKALVGPLVTMYDEAMELPDPKMRDAAFKEIAKNIWKAVHTDNKSISRRKYPRCLEEHFGKRGPSFTIVFIPASHVLEMAYKNASKVDFNGQKMSLQEASYGAGVLLATPTMVMALLTMIKDEWQSYQVDQKTKEVKNLAVEMYNKHVIFGDRLREIGQGLKSANEAYKKGITSYQGKQGIALTGKRMSEYGMKAGGKKIPEITNAHELTNPEDVEDLPSIPSEDG